MLIGVEGQGCSMAGGGVGQGARCPGRLGLRPRTHGHSITQPQPPGAGRSTGPSEPTEPLPWRPGRVRHAPRPPAPTPPRSGEPGALWETHARVASPEDTAHQARCPSPCPYCDGPARVPSPTGRCVHGPSWGQARAALLSGWQETDRGGRGGVGRRRPGQRWGAGSRLRREVSGTVSENGVRGSGEGGDAATLLEDRDGLFLRPGPQRGTPHPPTAHSSYPGGRDPVRVGWPHHRTWVPKGSRGKLVASVPGATPGGRLGPGSRVDGGRQVKRPGLSPRPLRPAPRPCPTSTAPHFCLAPRDPECRPPGGPEDQSTLCSHFPGAVPTELVGPPGWQRAVPAQGQLSELCAWQVGCPRPQ